MSVYFDGASYLWNSLKSPVRTEPITISCWFKPQSDMVTSQVISILDKDVNTRAVGVQFTGAIAGDPIRVYTYFADFISVSLGAFSVGKWHHVVGTFSWDYREGMVDSGQVLFDGTNNSETTGFPFLDSVSIGVVKRPSITAYAIGAVAEVAVWADTRLDPREMYALGFVSPDSVRRDKLVWYSSFREQFEVPEIGKDMPLVAVGTPTLLDDHPDIRRAERQRLAVAFNLSEAAMATIFRRSNTLQNRIGTRMPV